MQTILDISKWQGAIDPQKMKANGIKTVKIRVTVGDYYEDPMWKTYYDQLKAAGIKVGAYFVTRPHVSAAKHVDFIKKVLGDTAFDIPHTVDDEIYTDYSGKVIANSVIDACVKDVCEGIGAGEIYSNWNHITSHHSDKGWMLDYKLHLAWFTTGNATRIPDSRIPNPWLAAWKAGEIPQPYVLWQYSDKGQGSVYGTSSSSLDLNKPWTGMDYDNLYGEPEPTPEQPLTDKEKLDILWAWYSESH